MMENSFLTGTQHIAQTQAAVPAPLSPAATAVYILSCPFSGSTWLNFMLGSHPQIIGIGELRSLGRTGRPACRLHGEECPFWSRFEPASSEDPHLQVARLSGKRLITDTSKWDRSIPRSTDPRVRSRCIFLIRDGRAVIASALRKGRMRGMRRAATWWVELFENKRRMFEEFGPADRLEIRYEDLTRDPAGELRRMCEFLGVEFDPVMLEYWNAEHHPLAGNVGTLMGMLRKSGQELPQDAIERSKKDRLEWDLSFYKDADAAQFQDERWKKELGPWKRLIFRFYGGRLNRQLGYGRDGLASRPNTSSPGRQAGT